MWLYVVKETSFNLGSLYHLLDVHMCMENILRL